MSVLMKNFYYIVNDFFSLINIYTYTIVLIHNLSLK